MEFHVVNQIIQGGRDVRVKTCAKLRLTLHVHRVKYLRFNGLSSYDCCRLYTTVTVGCIFYRLVNNWPILVIKLREGREDFSLFFLFDNNLTLTFFNI
jgi:hypothetical protein